MKPPHDNYVIVSSERGIIEGRLECDPEALKRLVVALAKKAAWEDHQAEMAAAAKVDQVRSCSSGRSTTSQGGGCDTGEPG